MLIYASSSTGIRFPNIDPVAFSIGPVDIRWYALSYVAGIFLGWWYLGRLDRKEPKVLSQRAYDDFIMWAVIGVILGGRIGYVLFYNTAYYFQNPASILRVWEGGMSFHGGLIGSIAAIFVMSKLYKLDFLRVADLAACITPIGLFFGRIANFINGELYGRETEVAWGVIFPKQLFPRHPSQLYEAFLEGMVLFTIMLIFSQISSVREKRGVLGGIFLTFYAIFRIIVEFFREPDTQLGLFGGVISMGQILSIPMLLLGIFLIIRPKLGAR